MGTILFIICMFIIFIIQLIYIFIIKRKKLSSIKSFIFITKKYKLKLDDKKMKKLSFILICINTLIFALPIWLTFNTNLNIYIITFISLIIFIVGILFLYNLIGKILKKKGW